MNRINEVITNELLHKINKIKEAEGIKEVRIGILRILDNLSITEEEKKDENLSVGK